MPESYQLKVAVCDDDKSERAVTIGMLSEYLDINNYLVKIDEFESGEELVSHGVKEYNLIVLDIFMKELNGIETAHKLIEDNPEIKIIFCSTSNAYAAESYDVSALRYLNKPIEKDKLFATLDKFFHIHTSLRTITVKQNRMDESVYINEIIWIEADGHKCIIHTVREDIVTRTPFAQLCEQLSECGFVKPIRYAFVSLKYVSAIPTDVFTLRNGDVVPISRENRAVMKKAFSDFKMRSMLQKGGVV